MTWVDLILGFIKIGIGIAFLFTMAVLTVWADRRQGAMAQDRIGPMRAVVWLPDIAVRLLLSVPAVAAAGVVIITFWHTEPALRSARLMAALEIAVFVAWFSLLLLCARVRRHGPDNAIDRTVAGVDPRTYFWVGLALHVAVAGLALSIPPGLQALALSASALLAGVVIMSAGVYAAAKVPDGQIGLRVIGLLHPIADSLKMLWKEDLRPKHADKLLYALAPLVSTMAALIVFTVVPFGSPLCFRDVDANGALNLGDLWELAPLLDSAAGTCPAGYLTVPLQVADLNVGLLFIFAIAGTGVVGAALAGWASDNKFALLGGLRATSQMVSYEVAMGLSAVGLLLCYGTVHMQQLVDWQGANAWGIFVQPVGFVLFFAALVAETKRVPFDLPEGESEIVAGYLLEYSGMKFGLFFVGEYVEFGFSSIVLVTLFLGGYHLPFLHADGLHIAFGDWHLLDLELSHLAVSLIHLLTFFGKVIFVAWAQVFIRWTLPRFRYDQLMNLGWKKLLPLALGNIVVTGAIVLALQEGGEGVAAALQLLADITQGIVALGALAGIVALTAFLLEPARHRTFLGTTAARFAAAAGGTKITKLQA